ncbi:MAG: MoaD/ThiS family protein [Bacteroidota bacterium]
MIDVRLKLFGPLKDIASANEIVLSVPPPHNGEAAFKALAALYPRVQQWKSSVRLAVNLEYASFDHILKQGDEISFIPPVSGG